MHESGCDLVVVQVVNHLGTVKYVVELCVIK